MKNYLDKFKLSKNIGKDKKPIDWSLATRVYLSAIPETGWKLCDGRAEKIW